MLLNTRLLGLFSLRAILRGVFGTYVVAALAILALAIGTDGTPHIGAFALIFVPILFAHALIMPNLNSAALIPMGALAGTAAAIIGTISTFGGALIGALIDVSCNAILPLSTGLATGATAAFALFMWSDGVWGEAVGRTEEVPTA
ncbi:MAG: hypothetical protein ACR2N9_10015 [Acidimicrobiia bacterium]